ncbi:hypothetical protein PSAC2689_20142 [Paraburkholderia sacchari]
MPTVLRVAGARVVIFPNDHSPAHVHLVSPQGSCVFNLNCPGGPLALRERFVLAHHEVARLAGAIEPEIGRLCRQWQSIAAWRIQTWSTSATSSSKPPPGRHRKVRSRLPRGTSARTASSRSRSRTA